MPTLSLPDNMGVIKSEWTEVGVGGRYQDRRAGQGAGTKHIKRGNFVVECLVLGHLG
jgi:hypothetical protein